MNADGSGQTLVIDYPGAPGYVSTDPAWSPDGGKIVFGVRDSNNRGLCDAEFGDDICGLSHGQPDGTGLELLRRNWCSDVMLPLVVLRRYPRHVQLG